MSVEIYAKEIISLVEEIKVQKRYFSDFLAKCDSFNGTKEELNEILKGKSREDYIDYYSNYILELLNRIDNNNQRVMADFEDLKIEAVNKASESVSRVKDSPKKFYVSKHTRKRYIHDIGASEEILDRLTKKKEKKIKEVPEYTVYQTSSYGKLSNFFAGFITRLVVNGYPRFYSNISHSLRTADMKIFSQTYISRQIFTSVLLFLLFFLLSVSVNFLFNNVLIFTVVTTLAISMLVGIITFGFFYYYPATIASGRSRLIKNDLPFVIIHMAAVAGSGAKPISIFRLIASSHEYKGVEGEIKKIVNYVNLFGYDLSTAMKTVATSTPSLKFRDLLTGMVATIESGGSLKSYLSQMSEDAMNTYRLERKKYVDTLSTYSDVYTGILIAAPLLFIVTLAIINHLGGTIGTLTVGAVANIGTYIAMPFLNVVFILFLNIIQPET